MLQVDWPALSIGERIAMFRHVNGIKACDLARTAGIAKSYLSEIENGRKNFTVAIFQRFCAAMNVSANWLLTGSDDWLPTQVDAGDKGRSRRRKGHFRE